MGPFLKKLIKNLFLKAGLTLRFSKYDHDPEASFLDLLENEIDAVLYVGANRGQMMQKFLTRFSSVPIILYEADPKLAIYLESKFGSNLVSVRNKAVGAKNGQADFYVSVGTDGQSSSLLRMGERHLRWSPTSMQSEIVNVDIVALDSEEFDGYNSIFLKIDIQGFELEAFRGAETLLQKVVAIDVEVSTESMYEGDCTWFEVSDFLVSRDFQLFDIDPWFHDHTNKNEMLQADFRFIRKSLLSGRDY
jgi:FkbM family methyltransferase